MSVNGVKRQLLYMRTHQVVERRKMGRTVYWYLNLKNTEWILELQDAFSREHNVTL